MIVIRVSLVGRSWLDRLWNNWPLSEQGHQHLPTLVQKVILAMSPSGCQSDSART